MISIRQLTLLLSSSLFLSACSLLSKTSSTTSTASTTTSPLAITMSAQNGSNQSGTATITPLGNQIKVVLSFTNGDFSVPQPSHIHAGTCDKLGTIRYSLANVINGQAQTILDISLGDLLSLGDLVINTHKSAQQANVYTSCGQIKQP